MSVTATDVQLAAEVQATPAHVIERYRSNRNWQLFEKEFIYRNYPAAGKSWLDFGCGTGEITTQLALLGATHVIAADVTPGLLEITRKRAALDGVADRVTTLCGEIQHLEPQPVDVVLAYAVLHHLPDYLNEAMPVIRRWIKPGGMFICCEPVLYLSGLEWLRNHSGVPVQPLDPGERKLNDADLRCIERHFARCERTHFRVFNRLDKVVPSATRLFRNVDRAFLSLPGAKQIAGTVVLACHAD